MIPALREAFNRDFLPETYQQFLKSLEASAGTPIAFRVSETPCFLPKELLDQMADYGRDLVLQLVNSPELSAGFRRYRPMEIQRGQRVAAPHVPASGLRPGAQRPGRA